MHRVNNRPVVAAVYSLQHFQRMNDPILLNRTNLSAAQSDYLQTLSMSLYPILHQHHFSVPIPMLLILQVVSLLDDSMLFH